MQFSETAPLLYAQNGQRLAERSDHVGMELLILLLAPGLTLEPQHLASYALGRLDILAQRVADDQRLLGKNIQRLDAMDKNPRVRFAYSQVPCCQNTALPVPNSAWLISAVAVDSSSSFL